MEFTKDGDKLQTTITWHTMDERPEKTGEYLVIWHYTSDRTGADEYIAIVRDYSARYGLWGIYEDLYEDAREAVKEADRYNLDIVAWAERDFTECYKEDEEDF